MANNFPGAGYVSSGGSLVSGGGGAHCHSLGAGGGLASHTHSQSNALDMHSDANWLRHLIAMRMDPRYRHQGEYFPLPFERLEAHRIAEDRVVVFVVSGGQPVVFEDGALFPSDTLITQLRLLQAGNKVT